ncbi:MAG: type II toxin-antitoxin system RelE/ParE family toxin [Candidatus Omnitrophica bacterium]|nr:type II toxin-antitoxin system RelE/ParE family toxin [Candidatus Omnitrophota bacterium]
MTYRVVITPSGLQTLAAIPDRRIQQKIRERIDTLAHDPEQQGKPLGGELSGCRSLRAVGQRYRIIYRVDRAQIIVLILVVGLRKAGDKRDVYVLAKKLLRLRLV